MKNKVKRKVKFGIYNPDTMNVLSKNMYLDTQLGREKLANDIKSYRLLKPQVKVCQFIFSGDTLLESIPEVNLVRFN